MENSKRHSNGSNKKEFVPHSRTSIFTEAEGKARPSTDTSKPSSASHNAMPNTNDYHSSYPNGGQGNHKTKVKTDSLTVPSSVPNKRDKHSKKQESLSYSFNTPADKQNSKYENSLHPNSALNIKDKHRSKHDRTQHSYSGQTGRDKKSLKHEAPQNLEIIQNTRDKHISNQDNAQRTSIVQNNTDKYSQKQEISHQISNTQKSFNGTGIRDSQVKTSQQSSTVGSVKVKGGNIPMRRCASIDVGELNRKKKSKRGQKKMKIDKESLFALNKAADEAQCGAKRSGSLGNRPTSLKLIQNGSNQSNSAQNVFPTPVPQKRHSSSTTAGSDRKLSLHGNSLISDIELNETSAILPSKSKRKTNKTPIDVAIDLSDSEEPYLGTFPTGEGYRKHGLKCSFPSSPYHRIKSPVMRGTCLRIFGMILFSCLAFLLFCPTVALILVFFPICIIVKTFLKYCCCCCCRTNLGESCVCCICGQRLSLTEKFWLRNEVRDPQIVQSLIIVEYGLSAPQIINLINTRLVLVTGEDGGRLYPRFSQKIVQTCSEYVWKEDRNFFIHDHVFAMPKGIESLEDLQDYMSDMASRSLSFSRPLWEVQILTNFGDVRDTVLLFRMHPCVSDGVSMVKILYKSIADVDSVTTVPPHLGQENCLDSLKSLFYGPLVFLNKFVFAKKDFNLLHGKHVHLSGKKVVTWSEPFSLSRASRIKHVTRSTLNEVLMSATAGSLRNYLILNGIPNPYNMQTSIPVYFGAKKLTSGTGNHVTMLTVTLPTNTEGVVPRLWQMKEFMHEVHQFSLFSLTRRVFKLTHHMLTESFWTRLWVCLIKQCTCIISSLPGPEVNLRLSSKQIKTVFYWFPPVHQVALAISFFTYGDQLQMAVSSDRSVMPNPELITKDFIFQMQNLYDILGHRRIPGEQLSRKVDMTLLNNEIRPEETAEQIQKKMSAIHQELQNLKHKLDARGSETDQDHKIMKKIENLKEQFRELLVEVRKRKAAEVEMAITISEEDSTEDDDDFEIARRPFRRRAMSVSSRLSTTSVSSTFRPLTAATPAITPDFSPDSPLLSEKQVPYNSYSGERRASKTSTMKAYSSYRPASNRQAMEEFEILEYQYSPLLERRYKTQK